MTTTICDLFCSIFLVFMKEQCMFLWTIWLESTPQKKSSLRKLRHLGKQWNYSHSVRQSVSFFRNNIFLSKRFWEEIQNSGHWGLSASHGHLWYSHIQFPRQSSWVIIYFMMMICGCGRCNDMFWGWLMRIRFIIYVFLFCFYFNSFFSRYIFIIFNVKLWIHLFSYIVSLLQTSLIKCRIFLRLRHLLSQLVLFLSFYLIRYLLFLFDILFLFFSFHSFIFFPQIEYLLDSESGIFLWNFYIIQIHF